MNWVLMFFLAQNRIEDLSLLISSKLHFLSDCENNEKLSSVQVMTIKIDVRFVHLLSLQINYSTGC